jgi:hypothetical protein
MRPARSRCAAAAVAVGLALLGALLPAGPASAGLVPPPPPVPGPVVAVPDVSLPYRIGPTATPDCTAVASFKVSASGQLTAIVTAVVTGRCKGSEWVTCDVTLLGASQVLGRTRDQGLTECRAEVSFTGLQKTVYVNVGQVGYTASYPAFLYADVRTTVP